MSDARENTCPNCKQPAMDAYCGRCGEKRRGPADWKLSNIAGEALAEIVDVEHSKLWQSLRLLLLKPGQLTREYWEGKRKRFLGPVKLYLVFFALSLVLYSIHQPTAIYDVRTLAAANPGGNLPRLLDQQAQKRGVPREELAQQVSSRWQRYISMSQLAYPFFVALALKLLFLRRDLYFTQHLVFALHVLAFTHFSYAVLWPLYLAAGLQPAINQFTARYFLVTAVSFGWMAIYVLLALRRAYAANWLGASLQTAVVFMTYFAVSTLFLSLALALAFRGG